MMDYVLNDIRVDRISEEGLSLILVFYFYFNENHGRPYHAESIRTLRKVLEKQCDIHGTTLQTLPGNEGWLISDIEEIKNQFCKVEHGLEGIPDTISITVGATIFSEEDMALEKLRCHLAGMLKPWKDSVQENNSSQERFLGYLMAYKITVSAEAYHLNKNINYFIRQTNPLYGEEQPSTRLVQNFAKGQLFQIQHSSAATFDSPYLFLSLSPTGSGNALFSQLFYTNSSRLKKGVAYALKAQYQWLQFRSEHFQRVKTLLNEISDKSGELISFINSGKSHREIFRSLTSLSISYGDALIIQSAHKRLDISLNIQHQNLLELFRRDHEQSTIYKFLVQRAGQQHLESQQILDRTMAIRENSENAIRLAQNLQSKVSNDHSESIQFLLTMLGIGLGCIQIFDNESATGVLKYFNFTSQEVLEVDIIWWQKLLAKMCVTAVILLLTYLVIKLIRIIQKRSSKQAHKN